MLVMVAVTGHSGCSNETPEVNTAVAPSVQYEGTLDLANCERIAGWAMANDMPDAPIEVEIYDGTTLLATLPADGFREDLLKNKKGNGKHKFSCPVAGALRDGQPHQIHAKIVGTSFELKKSPQTLTCPAK